jgi:two-component system chemotaxis response regulator CheB
VSLASRPIDPREAEAVPARVMLVDDSGVSRALMTRWIEESGAGEVVATASNGRTAIDLLRRTAIDIVVLDIEMPLLDGIAALPQLIAARPSARILMASTISERGARVTLEALRLGAADAIAKPRAGWAAQGAPSFRDELVAKIRALAGGPTPLAPPVIPEPAAAPVVYERPARSHAPARVVAIGASTGGPNALFRLLGSLPQGLAAPILIAQHMPPMFTAVLAEHLARQTRLPVAEGRDGARVRPGHVYVAPGGFHMAVRGSATDACLVVSQDDPENFCRPSVNPLMRSAAALFGAQTLGLMLTGMGSDGLDGARAIVAAGGTVIVQDQATSVVWGMPGAVAREGLAHEVLPLESFAPAIVRQVGVA